MNIKGKAILSS